MLKRLLLLLVLAPALVLAKAPVAAKTEPAFAALAPTADQEKTTGFIAQLLSFSRYHYQPRALDDALAADIFERYLDALDGDRVFFLQSDIDRFSAWRTQLDDAIKAHKLVPAFDIFNLYVHRVVERTAYARKLVKQGKFDFTQPEEYRYDRTKLPWKANTAALDKVWRQRIKNDILRLKLAGKEMEEIRATLDKRYANFESRVRELKSEDVFQTFMNAYANAIEPHTAYMTPRVTENFNISMRLSLEGIGAVLQRKDEYTVIYSIVPGGPAALSGQIKVGDRILGVAQEKDQSFTDVIGWRIDDVVELIRGPKNTVVRLDILPVDAGLDGKHRTVAITRQKVKLEEQAAKREIIEVGGGDTRHRIGVIELPAFYQDFEAHRHDEADYRSATRDAAKLLAELRQEKVDGVVIDLRNNGGGSLTEAVALTGLFIDQGPVVQVRNSGGSVAVESDRDAGTAWNGPLAVLVNRASASASEIFAGAIQDYGRGLIIGEPTFGKGTVQTLLDLNVMDRSETDRYGQLKLTMAQFFRVDGDSTQHKGVTPDIRFPVTLDAEDYGESAFDNALPWTHIKPAGYRVVGNLQPLVPLLETRHEARVEQEPEFRWWAEDVAEYRRQRAQTTVSLQESVRIAERDRNEARRKQREVEREKLGAAAAGPALAAEDDGLQPDERNVADTAAREKAEGDKPDVLLREAAAILADAIDLLAADKTLASRVNISGTIPSPVSSDGDVTHSN